MTQVTRTMQDVIARLQLLPEEYKASDAVQDTAVDAKYQVQQDAAQKAYDDAVAAAKATLDAATSSIASTKATEVAGIAQARQERDAELQADIQVIQTGQPVTTDVPAAS